MTERADKGASMSNKPPRPRSVELATVAVGAQLLFAVVYAGLSWGFTAQIRRLIIDDNNKASHPKNPFDANKQLHMFRLATTQSTVLFVILLVLLTVMFRRGSGTGRWMFVVLCVIGGLFVQFVGSPLGIFAVTSKLPKAMGVVGTVSALASIVAIALLVVPGSATWFREMKLLANPGAAQRPPGLGSLFAPRRPAVPPPPPRGSARTAANPAQAKSKAKVRADAEAVAKGAELARSRAKANKSRRSD